MKPVKLSELIEALEFDSDEHVTKVDLQNGCVVSVDRSVLSAMEESDEESLGELPDWQEPELEIARAIVEDSGERFVDAPDKFDFHEYRQMEWFIGTVENRKRPARCHGLGGDVGIKYKYGRENPFRRNSHIAPIRNAEVGPQT